MFGMFRHATAFNQDIGQWNVSQVTDMGEMFKDARAFNQPIGRWNVANVTDMNKMFQNAAAFNKPIGNWNVSNGPNIEAIFGNSYTHDRPNVERSRQRVKDKRSYDVIKDAVQHKDAARDGNLGTDPIAQVFRNPYGARSDIKSYLGGKKRRKTRKRKYKTINNKSKKKNISRKRKQSNKKGKKTNNIHYYLLF